MKIVFIFASLLLISWLITTSQKALCESVLLSNEIGNSHFQSGHLNFMKIHKECKNCVKEFFAYPSKNNTYCSRGCYYTHYKRPLKRIKIECKFCKKEFSVKPYYFYRQFCSPQCSSKYISENTPKLELQCIGCGKIFNPYQNIKSRKYCSQECFTKHNIGSNNPEWKGDSVSYSGLHIYIKNNFGTPTKCEICGEENGRIEWASIEHSYTRNRKDWISVCTVCHTKLDDRVNTRFKLSVIRMDINKNIIEVFSSSREAAKKLNCERGSLYIAIYKKQLFEGSYWAYKSIS